MIKVSALHKTGIEELRKAIEQSVPEDFLREKILGDMVEEGGLVLLVMPQDIRRFRKSGAPCRSQMISTTFSCGPASAKADSSGCLAAS